MKVLKIILGIVGVMLVLGFIFGGGLSAVLSTDLNSPDGGVLGQAIGRILTLLIGIALIYYGFFKKASKKPVA